MSAALLAAGGYFLLNGDSIDGIAGALLILEGQRRGRRARRRRLRLALLMAAVRQARSRPPSYIR